MVQLCMALPDCVFLLATHAVRCVQLTIGALHRPRCALGGPKWAEVGADPGVVGMASRINPDHSPR